MGRARSPRLSIVLATRDGWPAVRFCLDPILRQVGDIGAEIVVADGSGHPVPAPSEVGPDVVWLEQPGSSVFQLYHRAFAGARAGIVALTEDHCRPRRDWLSAILRAFDEQPDAVAIGGAIENGSRGTAVDWASYFITQGIYMAPLPPRPRRISNESNVSYRRAALRDVSDHGGLGAMVLLHNEALRARGEKLFADDRIVVDHHQSFPLRETSAVHFHNGRSIAGFSRRRMSGRDRLRLICWPLLPVHRTVRTILAIVGKGRERRALLRCLHFVVWLEYCHAAGAALGYLSGPGHSPDRLH